MKNRLPLTLGPLLGPALHSVLPWDSLNSSANLVPRWRPCIAGTDGVAALYHEALDVAVEHSAVVVAASVEGQEVLCRAGHLVAEHLALDVAQVHMQRYRLPHSHRESGTWHGIGYDRMQVERGDES